MEDSIGLSFLQSIPTVSIQFPAKPPASTQSLSQFCAQLSAPASSSVGASRPPPFSVADEERRAKLLNCVELLKEPLSLVRSAVLTANPAQLVTVPFPLDFFVERLRSPQVVRSNATLPTGVRAETLLPMGNLGMDKQYLARKRVAEQNMRGREKELDPCAVDCILPPMSGLATSLALARPWPHYGGPGNYGSLGLIEGALLHFHRSPLRQITGDGVSALPVRVLTSRGYQVGNVPRNAADLWLGRDPQQQTGHSQPAFMLVEYSEQYPLMLHSPGMTGTVSRYYRTSGRSHSLPDAPPEPNQLAIMGPVGSLRRLESPFVPRVFGGNMVRLDSCITLLETAIIRSPVFRHKSPETDFLGVFTPATEGSGVSWVALRSIDLAYVGGQEEPLVKIEFPNAGRNAQYLKQRVFNECRRFFEQQKQLPGTEAIQELFAGERKNIVSRYVQEFASALLSGGSAALAGTEVMPSVESHALFEALREGQRRLRARGIGKLASMNVQRVQQYVKEIEDQMEDSQSESMVSAESGGLQLLRPLYYSCLDLLKELQLTPWNLATDYHEVVHGKRGSTFAFSAIGDPSGGRGEGVSFLRSNGLAAGGLPGSGEARGIAGDLRMKTKQELVYELQRASVPERVYANMSRWGMVRHLAIIKGSTSVISAGGEKVPIHQRKQVQVERLNLYWRKQFQALATPTPPLAAARPVNPPIPTSLPTAVTVSQPDDDDLLEDLLRDAAESPAAAPAPVAARATGAGAVAASAAAEKAELAAMRNMLQGKAGSALQSPQAQSSTSGIPRLKVVHTGVDRQSRAAYTKITYIYGERNIEVYRRWKRLHFEKDQIGEDSTSQLSMGGRGGPTASTRPWHDMVEEALRVHRRLTADLQEGRLTKADARSRRCRSCHWLGHDASFPGCPNSATVDEEEVEEDDVEAFAQAPVRDQQERDFPSPKRSRLDASMDSGSDQM